MQAIQGQQIELLVPKSVPLIDFVFPVGTVFTVEGGNGYGSYTLKERVYVDYQGKVKHLDLHVKDGEFRTLLTRSNIATFKIHIGQQASIQVLKRLDTAMKPLPYLPSNGIKEGYLNKRLIFNINGQDIFLEKGTKIYVAGYDGLNKAAYTIEKDSDISPEGLYYPLFRIELRDYVKSYADLR